MVLTVLTVTRIVRYGQHRELRDVSVPVRVVEPCSAGGRVVWCGDGGGAGLRRRRGMGRETGGACSDIWRYGHWQRVVLGADRDKRLPSTPSLPFPSHLPTILSPSLSFPLPPTLHPSTLFRSHSCHDQILPCR